MKRAFDKWLLTWSPLSARIYTGEAFAARAGWYAAVRHLRIPTAIMLVLAAVAGGLIGYSLRKAEPGEARTVYVVTTNALSDIRFEVVGPGGGEGK